LEGIDQYLNFFFLTTEHLGDCC